MLELRDRLMGLRVEEVLSLLLKTGGTVKIERETFIEGGEETSKLTLRALGNGCGDQEGLPPSKSFTQVVRTSTPFPCADSFRRTQLPLLSSRTA